MSLFVNEVIKFVVVETRMFELFMGNFFVSADYHSELFFPNLCCVSGPESRGEEQGISRWFSVVEPC